MFPDLDIDSIFDHHPPPNEATARKHESVKRTVKCAAEDFMDFVPACPERTLAIRHLQMAMMFANSAVAQHPVKD